MSADSQAVILSDLLLHPELAPCLDVDSRGNVVCFGWTSPIYTFDKELLEDLGDMDDLNDPAEQEGRSR